MIRFAHGSSSAADVGRQTNTARRLGVSPGPAGSKGPVIIDLVDARHAVRVDRVGRREERPQFLRIERVGLGHERDADFARARLDRHADLQRRVEFRRGFGVEPVVKRRRELFRRADRYGVDRCAVDQDLELMRRFESANRAGIVAPQRRLDQVCRRRRGTCA